jgi:hypothetical protein
MTVIAIIVFTFQLTCSLSQDTQVLSRKITQACFKEDKFPKEFVSPLQVCSDHVTVK